MRRLIAAIAFAFAFTAIARAEPPVAVVEDVQGKVTGAEFMDYVVPGQVIKLGQGGKVVLGYMKSCWRETISGIGTVIGDQTKLRQVVLNLLSNAAKFTKHGRVSVAPARERVAAGDWISIAVRDTGVGISRENLPKLFQNFSQVEAVPGHHPGGTGLGLALSQKFCRLMGGQITVESLPGRGSCFTVRLPARPLAA